jgi:hypothetical protein
MKRRTLLKSALGALTFGLVGQSKADPPEWRTETLPVQCYDATHSLGTIHLATLEFEVSGSGWTVRKVRNVSGHRLEPGRLVRWGKDVDG